MGNKINCVGTDRTEVTQEHEAECDVKEQQPDLTLQLA